MRRGILVSVNKAWIFVMQSWKSHGILSQQFHDNSVYSNHWISAHWRDKEHSLLKVDYDRNLVGSDFSHVCLDTHHLRVWFWIRQTYSYDLCFPGILCVSMANLEGEETYEASMLGTCDEVVQERICDDELVFIKGWVSQVLTVLKVNFIPHCFNYINW